MQTASGSLTIINPHTSNFQELTNALHERDPDTQEITRTVTTYETD